ncbi:MAG: EF-hand domain-containing protein [Candidatus Gastranaerophilales bacterium]|nr:EF-hand domain-containing protein [Candidatus Gastranaerophilales bacterium]
MSTFSASSLFAGVNSSLTNSYAILSNLYSDGLTKKNLTKALTNTTVLSSTYGSTFASYLSSNFSTLDKNNDGTLSASEVQSLLTQVSTRGLTREQVSSLGSMSGVSTDTQATILDHFTEIDTNGDGYVTSSEVQGYILQSKIENQKVKDTNKMINRTSLFYGDDDADDDTSSLLSYKWIQDDTSSSS